MNMANPWLTSTTFFRKSQLSLTVTVRGATNNDNSGAEAPPTNAAYCEVNSRSLKKCSREQSFTSEHLSSSQPLGVAQGLVLTLTEDAGEETAERRQFGDSHSLPIGKDEGRAGGDEQAERVHGLVGLGRVRGERLTDFQPHKRFRGRRTRR